MNIIFLGAPGSGKGTIAGMLSSVKHIPHISTGDIFREEIKAQTPLGKKVEKLVAKGAFVSDEDTISIIKRRLSQQDCENGFILDGFPRTIAQANSLDAIRKIDAVINFAISENALIVRLSNRRICPKCKRVYNLATSQRPKNNDGQCDFCGLKLVKRPDDEEAAIKARFEMYEEKTKPLIDYYERKKLLKTVSAEGEAKEILEHVLSVLK